MTAMGRTATVDDSSRSRSDSTVAERPGPAVVPRPPKRTFADVRRAPGAPTSSGYDYQNAAQGQRGVVTRAADTEKPREEQHETLYRLCHNGSVYQRFRDE